jgi:hypothetical protein
MRKLQVLTLLVIGASSTIAGQQRNLPQLKSKSSLQQMKSANGLEFGKGHVRTLGQRNPQLLQSKPFSSVTQTLVIRPDGSGTFTSAMTLPIGAEPKASCGTRNFTDRTEQGWNRRLSAFWRDNICHRTVVYEFADLNTLAQQFESSANSGSLRGDVLIRRFIRTGRTDIGIEIYSKAAMSPSDFKNAGIKEIYYKRTFVITIPKIETYTDNETALFDKTNNTIKWSLPSTQNNFEYSLAVHGKVNLGER